MSTRYIALRLLQVIPVLFGVSVVVFVLLRLIPGDPAVVLLGNHATPRAIAALNKELGLNRPLPVQYGIFLWNALHGNFGQSFIYRRPVLPIVLSRIPLTGALIGYSALLACLVTVPVAILAALHRGGRVDAAIRLVVTTSLGLPSFWVGILLALFLGVKLHAFPVGGAGGGGLNTLWHLTLPALTIALGMSPILIRSLRSSVIGVLDADFMATGRAMGLRRQTLGYSYMFRNAVLPVILVLSINIGWLLSGTVIVEQVFGLPGVGTLLVSAISSRDYAFIQVVTPLFALTVIVVNLLTDVVYAWLDPRIRLAR